ncbi:hypothetical protein CDD83_2764 [Cordyceps sp. RAO-2017]|nr:hypothetical protein CDD83_2764 [Cordyceps sp. RAO-2017]
MAMHQAKNTPRIRARLTLTPREAEPFRTTSTSVPTKDNRLGEARQGLAVGVLSRRSPLGGLELLQPRAVRLFLEDSQHPRREAFCSPVSDRVRFISSAMERSVETWPPTGTGRGGGRGRCRLSSAAAITARQPCVPARKLER